MIQLRRVVDVAEVLGVVIAGSVVLLFVNDYFSSSGEIYFGTNSESLMQTMPAAMLKAEPLASIFFNHIQPPLFDSLRALIAAFWSSGSTSLVEFVDLGIYGLYVLLFGGLSGLIFVWIRKATESRACAWVSVLIWVIHPSPISMATFLDGTFLSSVLITWMIYEIWLIDKTEGSSIRLGVVASLCFLTRAHFQWFFAPVLAVALLFLGINRRRIFPALAVLIFVIGLYCAKQFLLFGTVSSYGFYGEKLTSLFWIEEVGTLTNNNYQTVCDGMRMKNRTGCRDYFAARFPKEMIELKIKYPESAKAVSGGFNNEDRWWLSHIHSRIAKEQCRTDFGYCVKSLLRSVTQNFPEYWVETWDRSNPVVADDGGLPWIKAYVRVAHNYPFLIVCAGVVLIIRLTSTRKLSHARKAFSVSIVPLYVFSVTLLGNTYDAFEGGRLKFLLEPAIFIFIVIQVFHAVRYISIGSKQDSS